jgi:hypothetical protein
MLRLFTTNPSGSQEIKLVEQVPLQVWEALRRNAIRLMKSRLCYDASWEHLEKTSYELWRGTNGFGDEFELLHYKTDIESYTEIERENDRNENFFQGYVYREIAEALQILDRPIRFITVELDATESIQSVPAPKHLGITSEIVEAALRDAETLIRASGPANALDRVHTALHGYLEKICERAGIAAKEDANITTLFGRIRDEHPALKITDPQTQRMRVLVLRGMAQIIEALNPVRNEKTLAHPNPLLDEADAMLAINSIRTLLHYFDKRLK